MFGIYTDKTHRQNLLETYSFTFEYSGEGGLNSVMLRGNSVGSKDSTITSSGGLSAVEKFQDKLQKRISIFPDLPRKSHLDILPITKRQSGLIHNVPYSPFVSSLLAAASAWVPALSN